MTTMAVWQIVAGTVIVALIIPFLLFPEWTLETLRRKRYQYEVTFGLYMLTPTEKFILNSIFFLVISMITLATVIYLPSNLRYGSKRLFYYLSGRFSYPSYSSISEGVGSIQSNLQDSLSNASTNQLRQVSQNLVEGASDMARGILAAAAVQMGAGRDPAVSEIPPQDSGVVLEPSVVAGAEL